FYFQAEDGIRYFHVTGVQTCALPILRDNFERMQSMSDQDGRPLEVVALPMPSPIYYDDQRLPACYCNFYIANGVVVVPQFDDPRSEERRVGKEGMYLWLQVRLVTLS